jgi:DNA-binding NarL/FixJ family response regulator
MIQKLFRLPQVEFVGQARDVDEALRVLSLRKPRLVIVDLQLLGGTGLDVLRTVRSQSSDTRVIMTSGSLFPQDRKQCLKEGADYFFHLPDDIDDLEKLIHRLSMGGSD